MQSPQQAPTPISILTTKKPAANPEPRLDRCNSNSSTSSTSTGSMAGEQLQPGVALQQRVKQPRQPVGKRFFVSRVHPQQLLAEKCMEKPIEAKEKQREEGEGEEELISFRYTWPVRISERLIGADESAILNVSPPFCTAYNGVQFTWLLRICEENILDFGCSNDKTIRSRVQLPDGGIYEGEEDGEDFEPFGRKKVNITLYYKEGPARDVKLHGGSISIRNSNGLLFENMPLRELEYTKGGGWSPICGGGMDSVSSGQRKFSEFIHTHVGRQIVVRVKLEMPAGLFQPLQYLPSIDSPISGKLEALCATVLDQIRSNRLRVPDVEYFDPKTDKFALYRHVYQFACQEIHQRFSSQKQSPSPDDPELMEKIRNIFAHYYFNAVIVREAECFEDFLEALDASRHVQFPALRRECERYICAEVMAESADLTLVKKMLLLAERFNLAVLKMVSFGVIVDRLLVQQQEIKPNQQSGPLAKFGGHHHSMERSSDSGMTIESSMEEIREELLEIAEQIIHPAEHHTNPASSPHVQQLSGGAAAQRRVHSKSLCSPAKRLSTASSSAGSSADAEDNGEEDEEEEEEDEAESDPGGETLVGSVISQLEELARHIRKVSMPPGVRPAPLQNGRPLSPELAAQNSPSSVHSSSTDSATGGSVDSRRSSLKTGRDILLQQHRPERSNSSGNGHGLEGPSSLGANSFFTQLYGRLKNGSQGQQKRPLDNNCGRKKKLAVQFVQRVLLVGDEGEGGEEQLERGQKPLPVGHRWPCRKNALANPSTGIRLAPGESFEEDEGVEGDLLE